MCVCHLRFSLTFKVAGDQQKLYEVLRDTGEEKPSDLASFKTGLSIILMADSF